MDEREEHSRQKPKCRSKYADLTETEQNAIVARCIGDIRLYTLFLQLKFYRCKLFPRVFNLSAKSYSDSMDAIRE